MKKFEKPNCITSHRCYDIKKKKALKKIQIVKSFLSSLAYQPYKFILITLYCSLIIRKSFEIIYKQLFGNRFF